MKKTIFAFIAILSMMTVEAQNISDAIRYSSTDLYGSARFRAMSGAFGALGGDISSIDINPAGSAVFLNSMATLTLDMEKSENDVLFKNSMTSNSSSDFDLGQGGIVMVFNNNDENSDWRKFTLAFNYSKTANFEDDFVAAGTNSRSIDQYFLGHAQGVPLDLLVPLDGESISDLYSFLGENEGFGAQQAMLGYQGFILQAVDETDFQNTEYTSLVGPGSFDQEYSYAATGLNGKFSFNLATQYKDFLYMGINLNSHFINYDRAINYLERNDNQGSQINEIYFEDRLSTLGTGFSLQLGMLARINDHLRAGLAYESPTWYDISEETTQYLETYSNAEGTAVVDPNVINVYPEYSLRTPPKYTGSLAYLFGNRALISFDYSYKDYSTIKFKPKDDPAFAFQNDRISNELQGAATYRIGAEYRINQFSLRGGYRMEESPYEDQATLGELEGYSLGLGYNFGSVKLDLAYEAFDRDQNEQLFQTGLTDQAYLDRTFRNVVLSLSFGI